MVFPILLKGGVFILKQVNKIIYFCYMDISEARELFNEAIELSRNPQILSLASIAFSQKVRKEIYQELADEFEELQEQMSVIETNLEAMIFQSLKYNKIDVKLGMFALESNHGWGTENKDKTSVTIKIEGETSDSINRLLEE